MDIAETIRLCRVIASLKPAQKFDPETPAFWQPVVADIGLAEALEAVKQLAREERFIDTSDIVKRVTATRQTRAMAEADSLVPNVDPDDVAGFLAERRAIVAAAGAGILDAAQYAAGGITLSGAPPRRARAITAAADPERMVNIIESGVTLPRVDRESDRDRTEAEKAALELARSLQVAALADWTAENDDAASPRS